MIVMGKDLTGKYPTDIISQCLHDALGIYHSQTHASIIIQCLLATRTKLNAEIVVRLWPDWLDCFLQPRQVG